MCNQDRNQCECYCDCRAMPIFIRQSVPMVSIHFHTFKNKEKLILRMGHQKPVFGTNEWKALDE